MIPLEKKHVVSFVFNGIIGDSRVIKTAKSALHHGYKATLIGIAPREEQITFDLDGVNVLMFPKSCLRSLKDKMVRGEDIFDETAYIGSEIAKIKPDIMHTHDMYGLAIGANIMRHLSLHLGIIPWVHDLHEYTAGISVVNDNSSEFLIGLEHRYIKEPDALITVSPPLASLLVRDHKLTRSPTIINNCPERDSFNKDYAPTLREKLNIPKDDIFVVWVGRVNEFRGAHTVVEAVARIPNAHLAILTNQSNTYTDGLRSIAQKFGAENRFHIHGYVPNSEVTSFIQDADVGVHAGTHEVVNMTIALPNKLFEYLQAGIPSVVSDVPTMSEFVLEHGIGEVFVAENVDSAIAAIHRALDNKKLIKSKITDQLKSEYSWERQTQKLGEIYSSLLNQYANKSVPSNILDCRIVHGYTGAAGQSWATARGQRAIGLNADTVFLFESKYSFPCDRAIYLKNEDDSRYAFARLSEQYDVFHIYARGIYFKWVDRVTNYIDILLLRLRGKVVIVNFRGSEVRLHSQFAKYNRFNWVKENPENMISRIPEVMQVKYLDFVRRVASAITVIDPELQTYVPEAVIIPRAIDLGEWDYVGVSDNDIPLIVHAPTRRGVKGTESVLTAIDELRNEGLSFDFQLIENMSHSDAREAYKNADIVVDQLRIGWYGVLAVECMALGKAVVAYIREDLISHFEGDVIPVASANPDNIKDVLRELITNKEGRKKLGKVARAYCERTHDARLVAKQYKDLYANALAKPKPVDICFIDGVFHSIDKMIVELSAFKKRALKKAAASQSTLAKAPKVALSNVSKIELIQKYPSGPQKGLFDPPYSKIIPRMRRRLKEYFSKN